MATNRYPILDGDGLCVNVVMLDPAEIEIITAEELSQRLADEAAARQAAIDEAAQETADALAAWEAECAALRTPYDQAWATHTAEREAWLAAFATWEAGDKGTPPPAEPAQPTITLAVMPERPEPSAPVYPDPPTPRWAPPPGHTLGPAGEGGVGWTYDGTTWTNPNAPDLATLKAARITAAWKACDARVQAGEVQVACAGGTYAFGTDRDTERNIQAVVVAVLAGVVPNPRPWTPRGATTPIMVSNAELITIGATIMARIDALVQAYLTHKAAILALPDAAAVAAYDIESGWPV